MPIRSLPFFKKTWQLIKPYWQSNEKGIAYILLLVVVGFSLADVYFQVVYNNWSREFYDALQNYDGKGFWHLIIKFCWGIAAPVIIVRVYGAYLSQMLTIRWRRWMTNHYLGHWLQQQNYYHLQIGKHSATDNPDQRISEDIAQFITSSLELSLNLLNAIVTLFSFLTILWVLSGPLHFNLFGHTIYIQGYLVWAALGYAIIGTWLTSHIGRPLVGLNFNQQRLEANFRFSMVRLRENSENVAFYRGETQEKNILTGNFNHVFENFWAIMKRTKTLAWFVAPYNQTAIIFPFLVVAPRYFAKTIKLGDMMQVIGAFGYVQTSLSFIVNFYTNIASWKATTDRLLTFTEHMREAAQQQGFHPSYSPDNKLVAKNLSIFLPNDRILLEKINFDLQPADSLLITGPSGCGKTTLLRTLAGIWPYASGQLNSPEPSKMMFLPQKPYLPLGTLQEVLYYPHANGESDEKTLAVLRVCQLEHLYDRLPRAENWSHVLSVGEQQRIGFARAILTKPDFLFLDEATSAMDKKLESRLYESLRAHCPNTCLVSVGHHDSLQEWHTREWSCLDHIPPDTVFNIENAQAC